MDKRISEYHQMLVSGYVPLLNYGAPAVDVALDLVPVAAPSKAVPAPKAESPRLKAAVKIDAAAVSAKRILAALATGGPMNLRRFRALAALAARHPDRDVAALARQLAAGSNASEVSGMIRAIAR